MWSTSYLVFLCFICATLEWLCTGTRQLSLLLYLPNADQTSIQADRDDESSTSVLSVGSSTSDSSVEINPSSAHVVRLSEQIHFDGAHPVTWNVDETASRLQNTTPEFQRTAVNSWIRQHRETCIFHLDLLVTWTKNSPLVIFAWT